MIGPKEAMVVRISISTMLLASLIASSALAQGGSVVSGSVNSRVRSGSTVAVALGGYAKASVTEASIQNSHINGSADLSADVGNAYAVAAPGARAGIKVASVTNSNLGSVRQYARTGTLGSYAILPGSSTCVLVGSSGDRVGGSVNSVTSVGSLHAFNVGFLRKANIRINSSGGC